MTDLSEFGIDYKYIPVIAGPTASGKSSLAIRVAQKLGGEIISCDSMQIYKGLDIGTAKVTAEEQALVPHRMIDIVEPDVTFSVNDFKIRAEEEIRDILSSKRMPVLCGGTGQYISALCEGIKYVDEPVDKSITDKLNKEFEENGIDAIYDELVKIDPEAASKIHKNNTRRVLRAYAVYLGTGKTFTWWNQNSKTTGPSFPFKVFCYDIDRTVLYDRINQRVDVMMEEGLEEEVKGLYESGKIMNSTARQAIGYKELFDYFAGECSIDKAVYEIKLRSRHYAKRQLTWFRYMEGIKYLDPSDPEAATQAVISEIS